MRGAVEIPLLPQAVRREDHRLAEGVTWRGGVAHAQRRNDEGEQQPADEGANVH